MKALLLDRITDLTQNQAPLRLAELPRPVPGPHEVLVEVEVCGVCHTELDEIEGRTPPGHFPVIPGHQVVGQVVQLGAAAKALRLGQRVGVAWIFSACGQCRHCRAGAENLCPAFRATGRDANGGYAEYLVVPEAFAFPIPPRFKSAEAAPLLCAGAVGYRALRLSRLGHGETLGLTGFGASAHLVLKMVRHRFPEARIFVFSRSAPERRFALRLGATWAGDTTETPPQALDAIIDTTPAWQPVVAALRCLGPGGRLVINAIRKEDADKDCLLQLDYADQLWQEKQIKSVANVTRADVQEFLQLAAEIPLTPEYTEYPLEAANAALLEMKAGQIRGAKVLRVRPAAGS